MTDGRIYVSALNGRRHRSLSSIGDGVGSSDIFGCYGVSFNICVLLYAMQHCRPVLEAVPHVISRCSRCYISSSRQPLLSTVTDRRYIDWPLTAELLYYQCYHTAVSAEEDTVLNFSQDAACTIDREVRTENCYFSKSALVRNVANKQFCVTDVH